MSSRYAAWCGVLYDRDQRPRLAGSYLGKPVVVSPIARWSDIFVTPDAIIVGELGHLRHTLAIANILQAMRDDTRALLDKFAASVDDPGELDDGWGNVWPRCRPGCQMQIVRPGKVQCDPCDARAGT